MNQDQELLRDIESHMREMWDKRLLPASCWPVELAQRLTAALEANQAGDNLNCKSVQKRLATQWGFVQAEPARKPLSDDQIKCLDDSTHFHESSDWGLRFARAIERAHGIK